MTGSGRVLEERRDQHYLRRPGNLAVRRGRLRRGLLRRLLSIVLQVVVIAVLYLVGRQVYLAVITSPRFDVKTIAIRGNHHAKTADLLAQCGSVVSRNIFQVDLERLGEDLKRHPWVLDVATRRSLPSTLEVAVTEREPSAIASFDGTAYLVDGTGRILSEYGPDEAGYDFPVLTGIEGLPRADAVRRIRAGAAAIAALRAQRPELARRISTVDLASADRLAVHPADGSPLLYLDAEEPLRNLDEYDAVRAAIPRRLPEGDDGAPMKIAYIDLRFRGRISVMPVSSADSPDAAGRADTGPSSR
jgi:cell division protein FtsQ